LRELTRVWEWREAVAVLVSRNLKVRYKNSALGFVWSFLNPLAQIVVMTIVFRHIIGINIPNYSIHLFTVYLPWQFFSQALSDGSICVVENVQLLKKYPFPRLILPVATVLSNLIHMVLGVLLLTAIFVVLRVVVTPAFALVPVFLLIQLAFMLGLMLMVAVMRMYYEDIRFALEAMLKLWFYLTPLVYNIQMVVATDKLSLIWKKLYLLLNPITPSMIGYRSALLEGGNWPALPRLLASQPWTESFWFYLGISAIISGAVFVIGVVVWRKYEWQLPELM